MTVAASRAGLAVVDPKEGLHGHTLSQSPSRMCVVCLDEEAPVGGPPMTPKQIRELALQLYTIVFESEGVAQLTIWQRCLRTCQRCDVEPPTAVLISEALTGYLAAGWHPRTPLVTPLAKAQALLHQTAGAVHDGEGPPCPARTRLTPSTIAAMIEWVLTAGERPVGAGRSP